jgi:hypothetical protein
MRHLTAKEIKRYKLIVLPNATCLSDDQIAVLRNYVKNGGAIIASHKTSLFDEFGQKRHDFGLKDVFGASFRKDGPGGDYILKADNLKKLEYGFFRMKTGSSFSQTGVLPISTIELAPEQAQAMAELFHRREDANNFIPGFTKSYRPDDQTCCLATVNKFGKGQAILLGAKFGALYHKTALNFAREAITDAMELALADRESIKIRAPGCIEATAFMQNEKRMIIHLTNRQIGPERVEFSSLIYPSLYEPREVLPVYDIKVELKNITADKIKKAYIAPDHKSVSIKENPAGGISFNVPKVDHHQMLVLEMK